MNKLGLDNYEALVDEYVIASTTDVNGIITHASNLFCKMTGFSKEELIGKSHSIIRHSDMESKVFKDMWNTLLSGKAWRGDIKNLAKNGNYYWVDSIISPIINESGNTIGYKSFRFDITYKKELELKTQEAQALSDTIETFLLDENFDTKEFQNIVRRRKDENKIQYIAPELWE